MTTFALIVRPEYLEICEGDHCAAAILDLFQRWTKGKQRKGSTPWIYGKTQDALVDDLLGMFSRNRVSAALMKLRNWGLVFARPNPLLPYDRTLQYQVDEAAVAEMLDLLNPKPCIVSGGAVHRFNQDDGSSHLVQSSFYTKNPTEIHNSESTSFADAGEALRVGVVGQFSIPTGELAEGKDQQPEIRDDQSDEHEPYAFQGVIANTDAAIHPPSVPPVSPLSPDDTPTEEETQEDDSSVPEWAAQFFNCTPDELRLLFADADRARRLSGWRLYAQDNPRIGNPPGFVRSQAEKGLEPPRSAMPTSRSVFQDAYLDFYANADDLKRVHGGAQ